MEWVDVWKWWKPMPYKEMSDSVDEAIEEMKEFIEECNKAREEMRKELRLKLKELIERLGNKIREEELIEKVYSP